jgi:protoporphyrinogen oxidase
MKNSADIIIIGAGIAGLAAGCYAQMNGFRSQIFEIHHQPGGLCTAWQRQGFVFDGCIHYLFGSWQGQPFYHLWAELGVVPQQQFFHHDELLRVSDGMGMGMMSGTQGDRNFIEMMIPHHDGAVKMADLILKRTKRPELRQLATAINCDQTREIGQMKTRFLLFTSSSNCSLTLEN